MHRATIRPRRASLYDADVVRRIADAEQADIVIDVSILYLLVRGNVPFLSLPQIQVFVVDTRTENRERFATGTPPPIYRCRNANGTKCGSTSYT